MRSAMSASQAIKVLKLLDSESSKYAENLKLIKEKYISNKTLDDFLFSKWMQMDEVKRMEVCREHGIAYHLFISIPDNSLASLRPFPQGYIHNFILENGRLEINCKLAFNRGKLVYVVCGDYDRFVIDPNMCTFLRFKGKDLNDYFERATARMRKEYDEVITRYSI